MKPRTGKPTTAPAETEPAPVLLAELRAHVKDWLHGSRNRFDSRRDITETAIRYCLALDKEEQDD